MPPSARHVERGPRSRRQCNPGGASIAGPRWRPLPAWQVSLTTVACVDETALTHVDERGAASMVDVSGKDVTVRTAHAQARFVTTAEVIALLRRNGLPKGDALAVARIAGIAAAKRTPDLVPLCHPVALHGVTVDLDLADDHIVITATTRTADRTGVEMEALTSVVVAGLALYDMVKAVDRSATLTDVRLIEKSGGRSGEWTRP